MRTALACYSILVSLAILVVFLGCKLLVQVRYARLPHAVSVAVDARFPDCRKLGVIWDDSFHTYQIEVSDDRNIYAIEVRPNGEIVQVNPDAEENCRPA
jgi:hypothetical protein